MDKPSLNWNLGYRQKSARQLSIMLNQYVGGVQAIAPTSFVDAARKLSEGLNTPLLSTAEFIHLMTRFSDELSAVAEQTATE